MSEEKTLQRSKPIQKILEEQPSTLLRWGTLFTFLAITAIIVALWFIKYPDVVNTDVVITDATPPIPVTTNTQGLLSEIFVEEGTPVQKGDKLAIIKSNAKLADIEAVNTSLKLFDPYNIITFSFFDSLKNGLTDELELGEIRPSYNALLNAIKEYKIGYQTPNSKIATYQSRISSLKRLISEEENKILILEKNLILQDSLMDREQDRMAEDKTITSMALERIISTRLDMEQDLLNYNASIQTKQLEISDLQSQVILTRQENTRGTSLAFEDIDKKKKVLETQMQDWSERYLMVAPEAGQISFYEKKRGDTKFYQEGDKIMAILPLNDEEIIGKVALDVRHNGKVGELQNVLIKLSSYPYQEFGKIRGKVRYKADIAKDNLVALEIELTNGLTTTNGKEIPQEQQLTGIAEIITEEKRLLQRIYEKVF